MGGGEGGGGGALNEPVCRTSAVSGGHETDMTRREGSSVPAGPTDKL